MNKQFVILLLVIVFIVGGIVLFAQQKKSEKSSPTVLTKVSFVLDYLPWSGQSGLWVAKEKGYFLDEGLDVVFNIPSDPSTVLQTVASGRDDFGVNYQMNLFLARNQGIPVVSVMGIVQHTLTSILSLKESNIAQPLDLVGKKVGTTGTQEVEKFLETVLKSQKKSIKDVELVNVGFDVVPALIGKKVDAIIPAYSVYEAISAENKGFPVNIIRLEQYGVPDYYEFILVTTEDKIAKNPELVQHFVKAVKRGYEDAIANPEDAIRIMKKANPVLGWDHGLLNIQNGLSGA